MKIVEVKKKRERERERERERGGEKESRGDKRGVGATDQHKRNKKGTHNTLYRWVPHTVAAKYLEPQNYSMEPHEAHSLWNAHLWKERVLD